MKEGRMLLYWILLNPLVVNSFSIPSTTRKSKSLSPFPSLRISISDITSTRSSNPSNEQQKDEDFLDWNSMKEEDLHQQEEQLQQKEQQEEKVSIRRWKRPKKVPLIAVVGRPNVGKSALVNRIAGTQSGGAIVADEPGITRDRTYRNAEFLGERIQLVDTGGLVFDDNSDSLFSKEIREQAMIAIEESSAVILVVDGRTGPTSLDYDLAQFLRTEIQTGQNTNNNKNNKKKNGISSGIGNRKIPVIVAVNKCESEQTGSLFASQFWSLGLGEPLPISALHGVGTAELMETMFASMMKYQSVIPGFGTKAEQLQNAKRALKKRDVPKKDEDDMDAFLRQYGLGPNEDDVLRKYEEALAAFDDDDEQEEINVAIVGRPNVGKSSLLNTIFGSNRAIVSDIAGTTRDSIDALMERPNINDPTKPPRLYRFVDTAGIRRKGKVDFGPEFFMVNRALRAIRRSDVALLILDATAGVTDQDRTLAQKISDDGRACIILCNKWDAVLHKDSNTYHKSIQYVRDELPQVRWAPILFISALTGQRCSGNKLYSLIDDAIQSHSRRFSTSLLNEVLRDAILWQPPPSSKRNNNQSQPKLYYCHQVSTNPPTIVMFCNDPKLLSDNYRRYLDRKFRESLHGLESTPIRWIYRGKRIRDLMRGGGSSSKKKGMNGNPGDGGAGTNYPFPHAY